MQLDPSTLTFAGSFVAFASAAVLLLHWWQRPQDRTLLWWGLANCSNGIGIGLLALLGVVPNVLSRDLGHAALTFGALLTFMAAQIFNRGRVLRIPFATVLVAYVVYFAAAPLLDPRMALLIGVGFSAGLYLASALEFCLGRDDVLRARWPLIALLTIQAIAIALAGVEIFDSVALTPRASVSLLGIIHFVSLVYQVASAVFVVAMLNEREEKNYRKAAMTDPLTGLINRRAFMERATLMFDRSRVAGDPISVLAFDLDRFKRVNDMFGHAMGDRVLGVFAAVLSRTLRPTDVAGRLGGEEFVALLPGCEAVAAEAIAGRVRATFCEAGLFVDGRRIAATVSVGAVAIDGDASLAGALARADEALYRAKELGRNRVVLVTIGEALSSQANLIRVA